MNPPTDQSGKGEFWETRDGNLYHIGLNPVKEDEPICSVGGGSGAGVVGCGARFEPQTEGR